MKSSTSSNSKSIELKALSSKSPCYDKLSADLKAYYLKFGGTKGCPPIRSVSTRSVYNAVAASGMDAAPREDLIKFVAMCLVLREKGIPNGDDTISALLARSVMSDEAVKRYLASPVGSEASGALSSKARHFPASEMEVRQCLDNIQVMAGDVSVTNSYNQLRSAVKKDLAVIIPKNVQNENRLPASISPHVVMFKAWTGVAWPRAGDVHQSFIGLVAKLSDRDQTPEFYTPRVQEVLSFNLASPKEAPEKYEVSEVFAEFGLTRVWKNNKKVLYHSDSQECNLKDDEIAYWGASPGGGLYVCEGFALDAKKIKLFKGRFFSMGIGKPNLLDLDVLKSILLLVIAYGGQTLAVRAGYKFVTPSKATRVVSQIGPKPGALMIFDEPSKQQTVYLDHDYKKMYGVIKGKTVFLKNYDNPGSHNYKVSNECGTVRYGLFSALPDDWIEQRFPKGLCRTCKVIEKDHACPQDEDQEEFEMEEEVSVPPSSSSTSSSSSMSVADPAAASGSVPSSNSVPQADSVPTSSSAPVKQKKKKAKVPEHPSVTFFRNRGVKPFLTQAEIVEHYTHAIPLPGNVIGKVCYMYLDALITTANDVSCPHYDTEAKAIKAKVSGVDIAYLENKGGLLSPCAMGSSPYLGVYLHAIRHGLRLAVSVMEHEKVCVVGLPFEEVKLIPQYAAGCADAVVPPADVPKILCSDDTALMDAVDLREVSCPDAHISSGTDDLFEGAEDDDYVPSTALINNT